MPGRFRYDLIPPGSRVLCALSGGMDSMYLLCRLLEGAPGGVVVGGPHIIATPQPPQHQAADQVH